MTTLAKISSRSVARTFGILIGAAFASSTTARNPTTKLFAQNVGHLVDTRLDPLINPGTCSSHVHSVYGNAGFGKKVKKKMFRDKNWRDDVEKKYNRTTSELVPNLSSYWVPSLYIWDEAGGRFHLTPSFVRPYYRIEHTRSDDTRSTINPYPDFLRMVVGDASRKEEWRANETDRDDIRWTLTTYNRKTTNYIEHGDWSYLKELDPSIIAGRGQVEMLLKFPNCLAVNKRGRPLTKSKDYRTHASYTTEVWDDARGWCPPTHPYPIPRLDLETRYDLVAMRKHLGGAVVDDPRNWRLSTGDESGAGGHADFVSGWPSDLLTNVIANCTDGRDDDGRDCFLDGMDLDGRDGKSKTVPFTNKVPKEAVHEVKSLPGINGEKCPKMVAS